MQPTAGGRTLVDADRIKAACIGDPLGPGQYVSASRVLQPLRSVLGRDVNPVPTPGHPRARASPRMRSQQVEGGIRLDSWYSTRVGGRRSCTQPTAGGRTLVDADRAARIGADRARLPTADQAIHASDGSSQGSTRQRAAFYLFVLSSVAMSIRCLRRATRGRARRRACASGGWRAAPGCEAVIDEGGAGVIGEGAEGAAEGGAELNPRTQATAARRMPMNADRVEAARIGDPAAAAEAARVGEPLPSSSRSGPRQGGLSDRRGAPRNIGSQL
ncbi:hypothetical protein EVAR_64424_1 [Eumeta japonica]|uniref:Uncharacterized protein n=1 Tax=Eumeta variegata TaxID=151549 RepID=A0A4C1ZLT3_EUMVA|nr:hypothetical protein EVAR_64424_1 [Eumeta japonica]